MLFYQNEGKTALQYADSPALKRLLKYPLHWAARKNNLRAAKAILRGKSKTSAKKILVQEDNYSDIPLGPAVQSGSSDMVKFLIDQGKRQG